MEVVDIQILAVIQVLEAIKVLADILAQEVTAVQVDMEEAPMAVETPTELLTGSKKKEKASYPAFLRTRLCLKPSAALFRVKSKKPFPEADPTPNNTHRAPAATAEATKAAAGTEVELVEPVELVAAVPQAKF